MTPKPQPCAPVWRPSQVERHVLCTHYDDCLDQAIEKDWAGFSCGGCPAYEQEHPGDVAWWDEQGENSKMLLICAGLIPEEVGECIARRLRT